MVGSSTEDNGVEVDGVHAPATTAPVPVVLVDENGNPAPVPVSVPITAPTLAGRRSRAGTLAVDEANARLRMPAPRAKDAPQFKGKNVTEFLDDLERAADTAGLAYRFLPAMVLRYCTQKVRYVVEGSSVWDEDDWSRARAYLKDRYGSNDERPETSADILRKWTRRHGKEGKFKTKRDVERYLRKFEELANPLLAEGDITQNEVNRNFFLGLPEPWRTHVFNKIPNGLGSRAPHKDTQMEWIRQYIEKRALYDDVEVLDLGLDDSDDESDSDDSEYECRKRRTGKAKKKVKFVTDEKEPGQSTKEKSSSSRPYNFDTELGNMTRKLEELKISSASSHQSPEEMHAEIRRLNQKIMELQTAVSTKNRAQGQAPPSHFPNSSEARYRCGLCGGICGPQPGAHPLGYNFCPEAQALMNEGLIKRDGQRLVQIDGTVLPAPTSEMGGVAQKLREMKRRQSGDKGKSPDFVRDTPPHMVSSSFSGLLFDGQEVLLDGAIGVASEEYTTNWGSFAAPATRTEKKSERHDPRKSKEKTDESIPTIRIPKATERAGSSSKSVPATNKSATKPPVQNTKEGVPRKGKDKEVELEEVEMEDGTKDKPKPKAKSTPAFHYTSNMKETVESDRVYGHVKDTMVTISIGTLLGLAPDLQKRFVEDLKVRREYATNKPTQVRVAIVEDVVDSDDEEYVVQVASASEGSSNDDEEEEKVETKVILNFDPDKISPSEIVEKYASAVRVHTVPVPLFAMITGKFQGLFGGVMATFMVDTGSELNLVPAAVHALTKLELDLDGTHWTLKGVNGRPTPLAGCVRDAPVLLGNYAFPHHFFVNPGPLGHDGGEIILGQPWLQWFAACIQYHRNGSMVMKLWQDGDPDKGKPSVMLSLTDPKSPRNKSKIPTGSKKKDRARIEEVSEN